MKSRYSFLAMFRPPIRLRKDMFILQNLLEEAACQQNIVLQTSQALNVAEGGNEDKSGSPEVIEGERLLLLASKLFILIPSQTEFIKMIVV